ncbi:DUF2931 family protein [Prevotella intermedia]|nr:DUF2931 family protein [Prevotella intermedia]
MNYSTRTKFPWVPNVSAPLNYPAGVKYAYLGFGNEGRRYPVMSSFADAGIGVNKGEVSFADLESDEGLDIPNSLEILWLSYAEGKLYKAHTKFSQELQNKILALLREGYNTEYGNEKLKHETYSSFLITMLPGGKVWLYMEGAARYVLVCDTIQAEPIEMTLGDFDKEALRVASTVQEYSKGCLEKKQIENLKVNGIPYGLWDKYRERFNYDIKFEFEDKNCKIDSLSVLYNFINGEFFYVSDGAKTELLSRPKEIYLEWNVGDIKYKGQFFFKEEEVLEIFSSIFSSTKRPQKGTLIVKISKYNNKFDIYLEIEGNKYFFKKTKIHVFRITPENKNDDDHLYYWNYEGEDVEQYLGE